MNNLFRVLLIAAISFLNTINAQELIQNSQKNPDKWIYLEYPRGFETILSEGNINIKWKYLNVEKVKIEYFKDSNWETIVENYEADKKSYRWQPENSFKSQFKLRILDNKDSSTFDISPNKIKIVELITDIKDPSTAYNETFSSNSILKLMPLGNSITQGRPEIVPQHFEGYRKKLKQMLTNNGLQFDFVGSKIDGDFADNQHEGNPGWHANHWFHNENYSLAHHLNSFLIQNPPDYILLHIGTNDIGEYYYELPLNDNTPDTTVSDVSNLLDSIYLFDPDIQVILAQIINRTDNPLTTDINETSATSEFNNKLSVMVDSNTNDEELYLVDMENALNYPGDLSDGVHPNETGYDKMAQTWFHSLRSVLPKISIKIFLQGAYDSGILNNNLNIPVNQPFSSLPWNYAGEETITGALPDDIVDWVIISLRDNLAKESECARRAGLLKSDGSVVDLDGISPLVFSVKSGNYYIVIEHRNHLPIMSSEKISVIP